MRQVVITGAAGGIGLGLVAAFEDAGYETITTDLIPAEGMIALDLADVTAVEEFTSSIEGPIHALINNGGIPDWNKPLEETTTDEWDHLLAVDLRAPWLLTKLLLPKFAPGASIVNISSIRNQMSDERNEPYSAAKAGLIGLTQALAVELGTRYGIRVNAISPGYIVHGTMVARPEDDRVHPAGRVGRPEDVATAAVYLCSDEASFVTGAEWIVDGGMSRVFAYPK